MFSNGLEQQIYEKITTNISPEWLQKNQVELSKQIESTIQQYLPLLQRAGNSLLGMSYTKVVSMIRERVQEELKPEYLAKVIPQIF